MHPYAVFFGATVTLWALVTAVVRPIKARSAAVVASAYADQPVLLTASALDTLKDTSVTPDNFADRVAEGQAQSAASSAHVSDNVGNSQIRKTIESDRQPSALYNEDNSAPYRMERAFGGRRENRKVGYYGADNRQLLERRHNR